MKKSFALNFRNHIQKCITYFLARAIMNLLSRCSFDVITETLSAKIFSYFPCLLLTFRKKQSRFFGLEWGEKFLQPL